MQAGPLLVTGFGPFGAVQDNPSARLAEALDGLVVAGVPVLGRTLPVSWRAAWPGLRSLVSERGPVAVVMFGVAVERRRVSVERLARNRQGTRADVEGSLPSEAECVPGGPATLETRLPWRLLAGAGPDVEISEDAGDYLCNHLFYKALHELPVSLPVGFVHLPARPGPAARAVVEAVAGWVSGAPRI